MKLRPHQSIASIFLQQHNYRLLADEPRVGKTAAALDAARRLGLKKILVICPVSVQYVWKYECTRWGMPLTVGVLDPGAQFCIVPWSRIGSGTLGAQLRAQHWDLIIADESHYAKSFDAKRTQAFYGRVQGRQRDTSAALFRHADRVWCLTGTPIPHDPSDLYPMMRSLFPETLVAVGGPDVTAYTDFEARYVMTRPQRVSTFRTIRVKIGGRNEAELGRRLGANMLRRKQTDIGIHPADHDLLPLAVTGHDMRDLESNLDIEAILEAIDNDSFGALDHLVTARVMHLTGILKSGAVVAAARDYLDGADKLVVAYWHKEVGNRLEAGLQDYGVLRVDGGTNAAARAQSIESFRSQPGYRVFLAQIAAAGEGIDLSAAPELWFAESVFSPRMMSQMADRVVNMNQTHQSLVRVCALAGSIDEKIQEALLRLYTTIRKVLEA